MQKNYSSQIGFLDPFSFYDHEVSDILEECEAALLSEPIISIDPTPIRNDRVLIVKEVPITENSWHHDLSILEALRPLIQIPSTSTGYGNDDNDLGMEETSLSYVTDASCTDQSENQSSCGDRIHLRFDPWNEKFQALKQFYQKHGHVHVSQGQNEDPVLAAWVKRQRYQHKLKSQGRRSTLTDEREMLLEQLGFVWESHAAVWEERLSDLCAFAETHGHCMVPTKYPENQQLSIWVKCQRRQYKLFLRGEKSTMTLERIKTLASLGFVFNPRKLKNSMEATEDTIQALESTMSNRRYD